MMRFLHKIFLLAVLVFAITIQAKAGDTLRVLFIGNSYTDVNNLPALIGNLAASGGDYLISSSSTPGGTTLQQHSTNPTTLGLIAQGKWDYVVLQEQSQIPSFPESQVQSEFYPYAKKLDSLIKAANICTKTVFYMTWGRKNGDPANCAFFPPLCTYRGMDSLLQLRYTNAADSNFAYISPVAPIWRRLRTVKPSLELYSSDESHPSLSGSFAAACTFYAVLFKKNPLAVTYDAGLPPPDATLIKTVTKQFVLDSLAYWYRFNPLPKAAATFSMSGATVSFTNNSKNSDQYSWVFGDGTSDSAKNPIYTYANAGVYQVKLVARKCKDTDTLLLPLVIRTTGITTPVSSHLVTIFPNPFENVLQLKSPVEIRSLSIYDFSGKLMYADNEVSAKEFEVDMLRFPAGIYRITIRTAKGVDHQMISKLR